MKFRLTALMAGLAITNIASAATEVDLHHQPASYINSKLSEQTNNSKLKIEIIRTDTDFNGTTHTRIRQAYDGIPVWDATGVIHTPKANVKSFKNTSISMNGIIYENIERDLSSVPALTLTANTAAQALQAAKSSHLKNTRLPANTAFQDDKTAPIIFIDDQKQAHRAYLTSFTYTTTSAVHRPTAIVDAVTHKVYRSWEGIMTITPEQQANAVTQARAKLKKMLDDNPKNPDIYDVTAGGIGGNEKTGEVVYDGGQGNLPGLPIKAVDIEGEFLPGSTVKITLCLLMNDDIAVYDTSTGDEIVADICIPNSAAHNGTAWLSTSKNQTRWNADEMNGGYSPSLDAFNAAVMVKGMYQDWFNTPALIDEDGSPGQYIMRTHFGRKFDNAFWDGEKMSFGDGGKMFYPLTSIGVTSHEISHGFTETHSDIDPSKPQMAALHESFSDMAAVAIEYYMTGTNTWDIGREIKKDEGALRYLNNPPKDGSSIDNLKDFDSTEPHAGGGITNKAFYLLATTKGWDTHMAFNVMATANLHYWTSSMNTLNDAACGVISATNDYGYNVADVRIAFTKVGIDTDNCDTK